MIGSKVRPLRRWAISVTCCCGLGTGLSGCTTRSDAKRVETQPQIEIVDRPIEPPAQSDSGSTRLLTVVDHLGLRIPNPRIRQVDNMGADPGSSILVATFSPRVGVAYEVSAPSYLTRLFRLGSHDVLSPEVILWPGSSVRGRVVLRGKPLIGAAVSIGDADRSVRTDTNGEFFVEGLAPGEHHLDVRGSSSEVQERLVLGMGVHLESLELSARESRKASPAVDGAGSTNEPPLQDVSGGLGHPSSDTVRVGGVVVSRGGRPVEGAVVIAFAGRINLGNLDSLGNLNAGDYATTDLGGKFELYVHHSVFVCTGEQGCGISVVAMPDGAAIGVHWASRAKENLRVTIGSFR